MSFPLLVSRFSVAQLPLETSPNPSSQSTALDGAGQLFASSFGGTAEVGSDIGPVEPLRPELGDPALLVIEAGADHLEELAAGDQLAGGLAARGGLAVGVGGVAGAEASNIPAPSLMMLDLVGQLVPRHADQQTD